MEAIPWSSTFDLSLLPKQAELQNRRSSGEELLHGKLQALDGRQTTLVHDQKVNPFQLRMRMVVMGEQESFHRVELGVSDSNKYGDNGGDTKEQCSSLVPTYVIKPS